MLSPTQSRLLGVAAALGLVLAACDTPEPAGLTFEVQAAVEPPELGDFVICKVGTDASFSVSVDGGAPTTVDVTDGQCVNVHKSEFANALVSATEIADPAITLDSIVTELFVLTNPVVVTKITGTNNVTQNINGDVGIIATFYNSPVPPPPPPGDQGCTPGFWKNHLGAWQGFSPGDDFDATFGTDLFDPDITLLQAAKQGGGHEKRLGRHAVAALLSAAHAGVAYPFTTAEVIALVQAGDADALEDANELGCPLGRDDF